MKSYETKLKVDTSEFDSSIDKSVAKAESKIAGIGSAASGIGGPGTAGGSQPSANTGSSGSTTPPAPAAPGSNTGKSGARNSFWGIASMFGANSSPYAVASVVGSVASSMGYGGALSKIALPLAAGGLFIGMLSRYSEVTQQLGDQMYLTGATQEENARASMLSRMAGNGPGGMGHEAMNLANALHGGSYGAGYMRSRGVIDYGPAQVDKMSNLIKAAKVLRGIKSQEQAIRVARDTGLSNMMWLRDLPQEDFDRLMNSQSDQLSPEQRRAHAIANANKSEIYSGASDLFKSISDLFWSNPFGEGLAIADAISLGIAGFALGGPWGAAAGIAIGYYGTLAIEEGVDWIFDKMFPKKSSAPKSQSQRAMDVHNVRTSLGDVGLGPRGQHAMPVSWRNQQMDDAMSGAAGRLGGYAL